MTAKNPIVLLVALLFLLTTTNFSRTQSDKRVNSHPPTPDFEAICGPTDHMSPQQFELLMQTIRSAWLEGNPEKATACFSSTAILSIPPSPGLVGRGSIAQVFKVGPSGPPKHADWHYLIFDPAQQIGAVEFTVERRIPMHGVIIVKISNGLISNWREYAIASDLSWEKFKGINNF